MIQHEHFEKKCEVPTVSRERRVCVGFLVKADVTEAMHSAGGNALQKPLSWPPIRPLGRVSWTRFKSRSPRARPRAFDFEKQTEIRNVDPGLKVRVLEGIRTKKLQGFDPS